MGYQPVLRANLAAGSLRIFPLRTALPPLDSDRGWDIAFSPDGRTVLRLIDAKTARLWDLASSRPRGQPLEHPEILAAAFSPDSRIVLTGGMDQTARLWDVTTGRPVGSPLAQ